MHIAVAEVIAGWRAVVDAAGISMRVRLIVIRKKNRRPSKSSRMAQCMVNMYAQYVIILNSTLNS